MGVQEQSGAHYRDFRGRGYLHPVVLDNRFPIKIPGCQENIHIEGLIKITV